MPTKGYKTVNIKEHIFEDIVVRLSNKYHMTKTAVVEQALLNFKKEKEEKDGKQPEHFDGTF